MTIKRYVPEEYYNSINSKKHLIVKWKDIFNSNIIELKKEGLYIVIDTILRVYGERDVLNNFVDIPKSFFQKILQNEYKLYIDYLIKESYIECDNLYSKDGRKALGYRLNADKLQANTNLIGIEINDKLFKKRTKAAITSSKSNLKINKQFKDNFKEFDIDFDAAYAKSITDYSLQIPSKKGIVMNLWSLKAIQYKLNTIKDRQLHNFRNSSNGRITTNLTLLNSEYKKFILGGYNYGLDITASQPSLILGLINMVKEERKEALSLVSSSLSSLSSYVYKMTQNYLGKEDHIRFWSEIKSINLPSEKDIENYKNIIKNGTLYENFMVEFGIKNRNELKTNILTSIYSSNKVYLPEKKYFNELYPSIWRFVQNIKNILKIDTNKKWGILAILLQSIESYIVIEAVMPELDKLKIKYQYVYDSLIINKKSLQITYDIMKSIPKRLYNIDLHIKAEDLITGKKIKIENDFVII